MIGAGLALTFVLGVAAAVSAQTSPASRRQAERYRHPWPPSQQFVRGWFAVVEETASGSPSPRWRVASSPGGAGIAFYFGETFATIFLPDIVKYLPFAVARASVNTGAATGGGFGNGDGGQALALPADTALLLVAAWLIGSPWSPRSSRNAPRSPAGSGRLENLRYHPSAARRNRVIRGASSVG